MFYEEKCQFNAPLAVLSITTSIRHLQNLKFSLNCCKIAKKNEILFPWEIPAHGYYFSEFNQVSAYILNGTKNRMKRKRVEFNAASLSWEMKASMIIR